MVGANGRADGLEVGHESNQFLPQSRVELNDGAFLVGEEPGRLLPFPDQLARHADQADIAKTGTDLQHPPLVLGQIEGVGHRLADR